MFDCKLSVLHLLENITARLLLGSYVIMTIPDAAVIIKKLREKGKKESDNYYHYGNEFFDIRTDTLDFPKGNYYGLSYDFFLSDGAVGVTDDKGNRIYVKEYFIELNNFIKLAESFGLVL